MLQVLHLERSNFFKKILHDILTVKGFLCTATGSIAEALDYLHDNSVDLIITGLELDGGTAEELITQLNSNGFSEIPVLVITSTDSIEIRKKYFSLGVVDYLLKKDVSYDMFNKYIDTLFFRELLGEKLKTLNIAVLDDSTVSLSIIRKIFELNDIFQVEYYNSARTLLAARKHYHLLLVDVVLPDISGEELILQYRKRCRNCVIIAISAIDNIKTVTNILGAGADDYLIKPFDGGLLMARLRANIRTFMVLEELEEKKRVLEKMAVTDGLTETYNHKHTHTLLEEKVRVAKERHSPLAIIMLDIDHFKAVNDAYGHQTGDNVLSTVANVIKENTREADIVGRYGGEEFLLILPDTDRKKAVQAAEHLRTKIESLSFKDGPAVTVSGGVAELGEESAMKLISRADDLLYEAKRAGRNRIES